MESMLCESPIALKEDELANYSNWLKRIIDFNDQPN